MRKSPGKTLLIFSTMLFLSACSDSNNSVSYSAAAEPAFEKANFSVRESVGQLHVTGAEENQMLSVYDASGTLVASGETDALGSLIFRGSSVE